jgi:hypothetical protein
MPETDIAEAIGFKKNLPKKSAAGNGPVRFD